MSNKVRENRIRRIAKRRGYVASRSRLRDPRAVGYGTWTITDRKGKHISPPGGWTLEQTEQWLAGMPEPPPPEPRRSVLKDMPGPPRPLGSHLKDMPRPPAPTEGEDPHGQNQN